MWQHIANEFKDYENIIGYEILNEPFGGNAYKNGLNTFSSGFDNDKYLLPFY